MAPYFQTRRVSDLGGRGMGGRGGRGGDLSVGGVDRRAAGAMQVAHGAVSSRVSASVIAAAGFAGKAGGATSLVPPGDRRAPVRRPWRRCGARATLAATALQVGHKIGRAHV